MRDPCMRRRPAKGMIGRRRDARVARPRMIRRKARVVLRLGTAMMLSFVVGTVPALRAEPSHAEGKLGNIEVGSQALAVTQADGDGVTDILVDGVDIGRFSPRTLEYIGAVGAAFTGATVQVDAALDTQVTVTPADSDSERAGHQVAMAADLDRLSVVVRAVPAGQPAIEYRILLDRDLADIADDQVRAAIAEQRGKKADSLLAVADLAAVETLDLSRRPVGGLAGLESATGLREIFLGSNRVDLAPIDGLGVSVRHAMTPGIGSVRWSSDELWRPVTRLETVERLYGVPLGMGRAFMSDGHLATIMAIDGGQANVLGSRARVSTVAVWDVSDPRHARRVKMYDREDTHDLRGPHGFGMWRRNGRTLLAAQTFRGIALFDVTEIGKRLERVSDLVLPNNRGSGYGGSWWLAVQAPYIYVAEVGAGLTIVDASIPNSPQVVANLPTGALGGVSPGSVFAVGNLLVVAEPAGRGYATLDISDPVRPFLIEAGDTFKGYSHHFTAGWLFTLGAHGVFVSGSPEDADSPKDLGDQNRLYVHRVGHDGGVAYVGEAGNGLGRGGYGSYQDGQFLGGFSTKVAKFSIDPPTLIGRGTGGMSDRDEEFVQPLGNLLFVGDDHGVPSPLIPHATEPDSVGPEVVWTHPPDGAEGVALTGRVGASMSDEIAASSLLPESFQVTSRAGTAVSGVLSVNQNNVNFSPRAPLEPDTTYDVAICGLADLMGNLGGCSSFSFATASTAAPPARCSLGSLAAVEVGVPVAYEPASVSGAPTSYRWQVGDDSAAGPQAVPEAEFTHAMPGRFPVTLTVSNDAGSQSCGGMRIVHEALTEHQPTASSSIVLGKAEVELRPGDPKNGSLLEAGIYVANPDNASVTRIDVENRKLWEVRVGAQPRTLAVGPDGNVWVAVEGAGRVVVLDRDGGRVRSIELGYGSAPYGIAFAPDGSAAYVTLGGTGQLLRLSPSGEKTGRIAVGPHPRGVAVSADSRRVFVTRFVTRFAESDGQGDDDASGEVYEVDASDFTLVRTIELGFDSGPDSESSGRGVPNYLSQVRISPDGKSAWVPSKKDNIARGTGRDGEALDFETQTRPIASRIDLETNAEVLASRVDFDDRSLAQAMAFTPLGDAFAVAFGGSNVLEVWDANALARLGEVAVGRAPLGMAFRPDGRRLYVHNHLDRSVTVLNTIGLSDGTSNEPTVVATVSTVGEEALAPAVLRGKRLFYNASDPRMSRDGYVACAGCHLDGGSDGMVWDRTQFGEGFRNTIDLRGRRGASVGRVHWSANFDEIQDFEHDIRDAFGGTGFMTDAEYGTGSRSEPLGDPKAGVSGDLDDLAAYLESLDRTPASPHRTGGKLTEAGLAGRAVFEAQRCARCHAGAGFTDERMHDVGTHSAGGGLQAVNTPTLRGVWMGAPFHHDGSAATLADVLSNAAHMGGSLTAQEKADLEAYLLQIDDRELAPTGLASSGEAELAALAITASLSASDNDQPFGLWGDAETLWVADNSDGRVYAYGFADGVRQRDREIDSAAHGNTHPTGLWSDGETVWVGDSQVSRLFAYGLSGERRESRDIELDKALASDLWGDGETLWVLDDVGRLRAYSLADGARRPELDATLDAETVWPTGVWSDGSRLLVLDAGQRVPELKVYRDGKLSAEEGLTLPVENGLLQALWSDGHALWVIDGLDGTLHTYALEPPSSNATLTLLRLSGVEVGPYSPSQAAYAGETVSAATTVSAYAASGASLMIAPGDADAETDGHQVSLAEGDNAITVTVTAADGSTQRTYAVTVTRALDSEATVPVETVSVEAVSTAVEEGAAAVFRVSRPAASARSLDVALAVSESGSVLLGIPPVTVTIAGDSTTAELSVATDDDRVDEGDGSVTATLLAGDGYEPGEKPSATVAVEDNDRTEYRLAIAPEDLREGEASTVTVSTIGSVTRPGDRELALRVEGLSASDYRLDASTVVLGPESTATTTATLTALDEGRSEPSESGVLVLLESGREVARAAFTIRRGEPLHVGGAPQVGGTLKAPQLPGEGPAEHRWLRDGEEIAGATGPSHVPTAADEGAALSVWVTRSGVARLSEETIPIWGPPGNPPLRADEEELLGTILTIGSTDAYPLKLAGYGRVSRASFGSLGETALGRGGESAELKAAFLNGLGEFAVGPPPRSLADAELWAYWDRYRIGPLAPDENLEFDLLTAPTPQPKAAYERHLRGDSDGVRVALSIRRRIGPPTATLSAATESVAEGAPAVFVLSLEEAADEALVVRVEVSQEGEVLDGAAPTTVAVARGSTTAELSVATDEDLVVEGAGSVTATLLAGDGYVLGDPASATVSVEDDDAASFALAVSPAELAEGGTARVTVSVEDGVTYAGDRTVELSLGGDVTASDYALGSASLRLPAGASSVATTLEALADGSDESAETARIAATVDGAEVASMMVSIRDASTDASLSALALDGVDIGTFDPETTSYAATVAAEVESTRVTAEPADVNARVEIADSAGSTHGTEHTSALSMGGNEITATVTAEDGATEQTYRVTVTRSAASETGITGPASADHPEGMRGMRVAVFESDGGPWSLSGPDGGLFTITGGVLRFIDPPDHENPADEGADNVYDLTLGVGAGETIESADVMVTVTDVDEPGVVTLAPRRPELNTPLVAELSDPDGVRGATVWQWERDAGREGWITIAGATAASYTPGAADADRYLRATATYADVFGAGKTARATAPHVVIAHRLSSLKVSGLTGVDGDDRGFYPEFDPDILHYAARCTRSLDLTLAAQEGDVRLSVDGVQRPTDQATTVEGLSGGSDIRIALTGAGGTRTTYTIHCIDRAEFPKLTTERFDGATEQLLVFKYRLKPEGQPWRSFIMLMDNNGVPRWHRRIGSRVYAYFRVAPEGTDSEGRFSYTWLGPGYDPDGVEMVVLDKYFNKVQDDIHVLSPFSYTGGRDHMIAPNGDYVLMAQSPNRRDLTFLGEAYPTLPNQQGRAPLWANEQVRDSVLQIRAPDGTVKFNWNAWDHMAIEDCIVKSQFTEDWGHINSMSWVDGDVILGFRHCSQILRIDIETGNVVWRAGPSLLSREQWESGATLQPNRGPAPLDIVNDPRGGFSGNHGGVLTADGNLLVYDNGDHCGVPPGVAQDAKGLTECAQRTRAVEYSLDLSAGELVFQREFRIPGRGRSGIAGHAEPLEKNSEWLVSWSDTSKVGPMPNTAMHIDAESGEAKLTMTMRHISGGNAGGIMNTRVVAASPVVLASRIEPLEAGILRSSERHAGVEDRPVVVVAFNRPVVDFDSATPSITVEGATASVSVHEQVGAPENAYAIELTPDGEGPVSLQVNSGLACGHGAICAADGSGLESVPDKLTIPFGPADEVTAEITDLPDSHDGSSSFSFTLVFDQEVELSHKDFSAGLLELTGAEVTRARRLDAPSNRRWEVTLEPTGSGPVVIVVSAGRACADVGAVCTADGVPLSTRLAVTVPGPVAAATPTASLAARTSLVVEGAPAEFVISLDAAPVERVEVALVVSETGSVLAGDGSASVVFEIGATTHVLSLPTDDDALDEEDGTVTVALSAGVGYVLGTDASAQVVVRDNDVAAVPEATLVSSGLVTEGGTLAFTLMLDAPAPDPSGLSVALAVEATGIVLAETSPASLTVAAGATSAVLELATEDNKVVAGDGSVTVALRPGAGYRLGEASSATAAVTDNDLAAFSLTVTPAELVEGASATVHTAVSNGVTHADPVTLNLSVTGEATAADYALESASLELAPGEDAASTTLTALADEVDDEGVETVRLLLTLDGEEVAAAALSIREASADASLAALALSGADIGPFDPQTTSYAATVAAGVASTTVTVDPADPNARVEITDEAGSTTGVSRTSALSAGDNEISVTVTAEDGTTEQTYRVTVTRAATPLTGRFASVPAAHDGSTEATLRLEFSEPVSTSYATLRDEAFKVTNGAVDSARRVDGRSDLWDIVVLPDTDADLTVVLPATSDCSASGAVCTADGRPFSLVLEATVPGPLVERVSIDAVSGRVAEGTAAVFRVSREAATARPLDIALAVSESGSVLSGALPATVTIARDSTTVELSLSTDDDLVVEGEGTVTVRLLGGDGYGLGEPVSATVLVEDDDLAEYALSARPPELAEGRTATLEVEVTNGVTHAGAVTLGLSVTGGVEGSDYALGSASLVLAAGAVRASTSFEALSDGVDEDAAEAARVGVAVDGAEVASTTVSIRDASTDASLASLELSDVDLGWFDPETTAYAGTAEVGSTTVRAEPADINARVEIADAAGSTRGRERTSALSAGENEITARVTAEDGAAERTYRVTVTRGAAPAWGARLPDRDLALPGLADASGLWSDGETAWVSEWDRILGYALSDGSRVASADIAGGALASSSLWSDGETLWQSDQSGAVRGYRLSDGEAAPSEDLSPSVMMEAGNGVPAGLWSDGSGLRVVDLSDGWLYGYGPDGEAAPGLGFDLRQGRSGFPWGLWSDGETALVTWDAEGALLGYRLSDGARLPGRDIDLGAHGNRHPRDLWSDGETLWVVDGRDRKAYAYAVPGLARSVPSGLLPVVVWNRARGVPGGDPGVRVAIPDPGLRARVAAALGKPGDAAVGARELAALRSLDARGAGIGDLTGLEGAVNLEALDLGGNPIANPGVLGRLPRLRILNLDGTGARPWAVAGLRNLTRLSLRGNGIERPGALSALDRLEALDIGDNRIADLSGLVPLAHLRELRADGNAIASIAPLAELTALEAADLRGNRIEDTSPLADIDARIDIHDHSTSE